jgi:TRAP-type mannitol/chloroaromatic compound transport system permease small subunit
MLARAVKVASFLSAISLMLLVLLVTYDALMRYLFNSGSIALQELEWHLFDVVILFSIAYTMHLNAHVRVDIFYDHFSKKTKSIISLISSLFFIIPLSALIIYVGFEFVMMSFSQMEGSSNPGGLPYRFIIKAVMPLAFLFLFLQAIKEIVDSFKEIKAY